MWSVFSALTSAIVWNIITWYYGLPSSSSHALIGGLVGSGLAAAGSSAIQWHGLWDKAVVPAIQSPIIGFLLAGGIMLAVLWGFRRARPTPLNRGFRLAQIASGTTMAFFHGTNDAQKTMGVITLALASSGHLGSSDTVPRWVIVLSGAAIGIGTYAGGWRIMRTMGTRIFNLEPPQGFAAQLAATGVLWYTGRVGFPISTTQVISGSVLGAGATTRASAVRWGVAANIVIAWVLTLPAAALVAALIYEMIGPIV